MKPDRCGMRYLRRYLGRVSAFLLLLSPLASNAGQWGSFTYTTTESGIQIDRYTGRDAIVAVPESIDELPVISLGDGAFSFASQITNLTLPSTLVSLGTNAFSYCTGLPGLTLPAGLRAVQSGAFFWCSGLTNMVLPESVNYLGDNAFFLCTGLTNLTLPTGLTDIPSNAFYLCLQLENLTLPAGVTNIGSQAFYGCSGLLGLTLPEPVASIGEKAFYYCSGLPAMALPASVTNIGTGAFSWCGELAEFTVDTRNPAFSQKDGVLFNLDQSVLIQYPGKRYGAYTVPDTVAELGACGFLSCTGLTSVTLPASVYTIGATSFLSTIALTNAFVDSANPAFTSRDGALLNKLETRFLLYPAGRTGSYRVPGGVTDLGDYAFAYCGGLTNLTLPISLASIGEGAFTYCGELTGVYTTGNPPALRGDQAFYETHAATVYRLPFAWGWADTFGGRPVSVWDPTYDEWALATGLVDLFPAASAEPDDADRDGSKNLEEMRAGTDPTKADSVLAFELAARPEALSEADQEPLAEGQFALYLRTVPGKSYDIYQCDRPKSPWRKAATFIATAPQSRIVLDRPGTLALYRAALVE
jgi:hypothetical protein